MKLAIERNRLLPALSSVIGAVPRRTTLMTLHILSYFHVVGDGQSIQITGTDLETTIQSRISEVSHTPFAALWPAKRMMDIVKSYPEDGMIGIAQDEPDKMVVKCGRSSFKLQTLDPQDYPIIGQDQVFEQQFTIEQQSLRSGLNKTDFAMAKQDVRYYLNGLLFYGKANQLILVATDGHRLAKTQYDLKTEFAAEWQVILPADAITEIKKGCNEGECRVDVGKNLSRFTFDDGQRILIVKHIDGTFPDYQRVIPRDLPKRINVDRELFLDALQRVRLVLDDTTAVQLNFTEGLIELSGGVGTDQAQDQVDAVYHGDELLIGLNSAYLIDVLRTMDDDEVELYCDKSNNAVRLASPEQPDDVYVIMPMRL